MSANPEELERRLAALEQEVKELRAMIAPPIDQTAAERGVEMLRRAKLTAPARVAAAKKAMEEMGLADIKPIGAEKLQEMMLAEGIRPEDNILSSEIIRLRYGEYP